MNTQWGQKCFIVHSFFFLNCHPSLIPIISAADIYCALNFVLLAVIIVFNFKGDSAFIINVFSFTLLIMIDATI